MKFGNTAFIENCLIEKSVLGKLFNLFQNKLVVALKYVKIRANDHFCRLKNLQVFVLQQTNSRLQLLDGFVIFDL